MGRIRGFAAGMLTAVLIVCAGAVGALAYFGGFSDIRNNAVKTAEASQNTKVNDTKEEENDLAEVSVSSGLNERAVFTYEIFNEITQSTDTLEGECPEELVGKSMADVKDFYSDWQVISFSDNNVLLRKVIGAADEERYVISSYDDCIAVFYENTEDGIYMMTDIPVNSLDHDKQVMVNDGIYVEGKDRLRRILEDYSS